MLRVLLLGTGDFAVPALKALHAQGYPVVAALSQPDRPAGRGRAVVPTPVHAAADELAIPHVQTPDISALRPTEFAHGADIGVVAAFGQKIGPALRAALPLGCVNIHGSLLPQYRGAAPFQWAILNGETTTGVTVFQLDDGWDTGPIWSQIAIPIGAIETADELHDRLASAGAELIVAALSAIESGQVQPAPQDPTQATRAPKLSKADAALDFSEPARQLVRRINGLWSWPAATCTFASRAGKTERLLLARAQILDDQTAPIDSLPPGAFTTDGAVQTGIGRIRLLEVKPAGGKLMSFEAFAHGRRLAPPDRLLPPEPT